MIRRVARVTAESHDLCKQHFGSWLRQHVLIFSPSTFPNLKAVNVPTVSLRVGTTRKASTNGPISVARAGLSSPALKLPRSPRGRRRRSAPRRAPGATRCCVPETAATRGRDARCRRKAAPVAVDEAGPGANPRKVIAPRLRPGHGGRIGEPEGAGLGDAKPSLFEEDRRKLSARAGVVPADADARVLARRRGSRRSGKSSASCRPIIAHPGR